MSKNEMTLVFYNPAEVLLVKAALVNYKKHHLYLNKR